jgi:Fe-S cluster biosynthesis and repair protein YggX
MAERMVQCAKLGKELPGIDVDSPAGARELKMVTLIAGPQMAQRVRERISAQAMEMWKSHMLMCMNEFRLDPSSEETNRVLASQMEAFFFGQTPDIPNYVPPKRD